MNKNELHKAMREGLTELAQKLKAAGYKVVFASHDGEKKWKRLPKQLPDWLRISIENEAGVKTDGWASTITRWSQKHCEDITVWYIAVSMDYPMRDRHYTSNKDTGKVNLDKAVVAFGIALKQSGAQQQKWDAEADSARKADKISNGLRQVFGKRVADFVTVDYAVAGGIEIKTFPVQFDDDDADTAKAVAEAICKALVDQGILPPKKTKRRK